MMSSTPFAYLQVVSGCLTSFHVLNSSISAAQGPHEVEGARVVSVASIGHLFSPVAWA